MIELGTTEFLLAIPARPETELRLLSSKLFDSWEAFSAVALSLPDYSLHLQVEEGSIRCTARVGAVLGALYVGIGNYGSFVSGIQTIAEQVHAAGSYLAEEATAVFSCPESRTTLRSRGGTLASLQRLFVRVQKGELSAADAASRAEALLGEDAASEPNFMKAFAEALENCPHFHHQDDLPFIHSVSDVSELQDSPKLPSRLPKRQPELGPLLQFRVEVWRDSKNKRKHTRVVKL